MITKLLFLNVSLMIYGTNKLFIKPAGTSRHPSSGHPGLRTGSGDRHDRSGDRHDRSGDRNDRSDRSHERPSSAHGDHSRHIDELQIRLDKVFIKFTQLWMDYILSRRGLSV